MNKEDIESRIAISLKPFNEKRYKIWIGIVKDGSYDFTKGIGYWEQRPDGSGVWDVIVNDPQLDTIYAVGLKDQYKNYSSKWCFKYINSEFIECTKSGRRKITEEEKQAVKEERNRKEQEEQAEHDRIRKAKIKAMYAEGKLKPRIEHYDIIKIKLKRGDKEYAVTLEVNKDTKSTAWDMLCIDLGNQLAASLLNIEPET